MVRSEKYRSSHHDKLPPQHRAGKPVASRRSEEQICRYVSPWPIFRARERGTAATKTLLHFRPPSHAPGLRQRATGYHAAAPAASCLPARRRPAPLHEGSSLETQLPRAIQPAKQTRALPGAIARHHSSDAHGPHMQHVRTYTHEYEYFPPSPQTLTPGSGVGPDISALAARLSTAVRSRRRGRPRKGPRVDWARRSRTGVLRWCCFTDVDMDIARICTHPTVYPNYGSMRMTFPYTDVTRRDRPYRVPRTACSIAHVRILSLKDLKVHTKCCECVPRET